MLPGRGGIQVVRGLRAADVHTPVLMLTARTQIEDRVEGLDAGADDYLPKPFALPELLARVRALTRRPRGSADGAGTGGATIRVGDVTLDPVRHTPEGGTVSGRERDGRAEASVRDMGPGVRPEHADRIFDRFYRAEEARTRTGGGTSLGLSIARDLARAQGGDLSAETLPREAEGTGGAVFRLELPAR